MAELAELWRKLGENLPDDADCDELTFDERIKAHQDLEFQVQQQLFQALRDAGYGG